MKFKTLPLLSIALALGSATSFAVPLVNPGDEHTDVPSGIVVSLESFQSSGTGVIDPFLRLQANDTETGFNTSFTPPPLDAKPGPWTHDLLFSSLQIVQRNGQSYYQISLDINQTQVLPQIINLTDFTLYTGNTANRTNLTGANLRVSLGEDYEINTINAGSGAGDVQFFIPVSFFAGNTDLYLTLSATFTGSNDGFEEFNAVTGPNGTIPDGGTTLMLLGASLGAIEMLRRRFRKSSPTT